MIIYFYIIWLSYFWGLSMLGEGYARNVASVLHLISTSLLP